ncbi:hypothetical protein SAMN02910358_01522 [Lachnospiraceae bacterium XBB1006]|nr:hypothetical protein SAMN02910358_01522 [Lachnospiraceae bacterium XBB1006]
MRTFRIGEVPALRNEKRLKKGMCCEAAVERQGRGHSEWLQPREATERRNVLRSSRKMKMKIKKKDILGGRNEKV